MGEWLYQAAVGGLHYSLGTDSGTYDRTGNGHHGAPFNVNQIGQAGRYTDGDGSAYFNGNDSRIVSNLDPFWDFQRPVLMPAELEEGIADGPFWSWPWQPHDYGAWNVRFVPHPGGPGSAPAGPPYGTWTNISNAKLPDRHAVVTGWARREDRSTGHLLFSHTGFEGPRVFVRGGSNTLVVCLQPNNPGGADQLGFKIDQGAQFDNAWPNDDRWTHFRFEFREKGLSVDPSPWSSRRWEPDNPYDTEVVEKVYLDQGQIQSQLPPATGWAGPLTLNAKLDPATWSYGTSYGSYTECLVWINGAPVSARQYYDLHGNIIGEFGAQGNCVTDFHTINNQRQATLPPDPDRTTANWRWWSTNTPSKPLRPLIRGDLVIGGQSLPARTDENYPDLLAPGMGDGYSVGSSPNHRDPMSGTLWNESLNAKAWKGWIDEFAVHKWEDRQAGGKDLGHRPVTPQAYFPGPTPAQLAAIP